MVKRVQAKERVPGLFEGSGYYRRDTKYPANDDKINSSPLVLHNRYGNVVGRNVYGGTESGRNIGEVIVKKHTRNKPNRR